MPSPGGLQSRGSARGHVTLRLELTSISTLRGTHGADLRKQAASYISLVRGVDLRNIGQINENLREKWTNQTSRYI